MTVWLPESLSFLIPCKDILAASTNEHELIKVIPIKKNNQMVVTTLLTGVFLGGALLSRAEIPDSFTRHGLPIPGAYFKNKESQKAATVAVSKSRKGVGENHTSTSQPEKSRH
jgi:hypothetical protein